MLAELHGLEHGWGPGCGPSAQAPALGVTEMPPWTSAWGPQTQSDRGARSQDSSRRTALGSPSFGPTGESGGKASRSHRQSGLKPRSPSGPGSVDTQMCSKPCRAPSTCGREAGSALDSHVGPAGKAAGGGARPAPVSGDGQGRAPSKHEAERAGCKGGAGAGGGG